MVLSKTFSRPANGSTAYYVVDLELSPISSAGCPAAVRQQVALTSAGVGGTFASNPVAGSTMVAVGFYRSGVTLPGDVGWTIQATGYFPDFITGDPQAGVIVATRTVRSGETTTVAKKDDGTDTGWVVATSGGFGVIYELQCGSTVDDAVGVGPLAGGAGTSTNIHTGTLTAPAGALVIGGVVTPTWDVVPGASVVPGAGITEDMDQIVGGFAPHGWAAHANPDAGSYSLTGVLTIDAGPPCPSWGAASIALL